MVKLDTWIAANEMEKVGDKAKLNIRGLIFSQKLSRWVQKVGKLLEASWAVDFAFAQRSKVSFRTNKRQDLCWLTTKPTQHGDPISNLWVGLIIKRRGCFSLNLITFALKRVSMTSLAPPSSESVLQRRHLEIFYTFLRIELRRQKLAAPSEVRKSVSYFKAFWKFGNKKCLGPFAIFAIHVKLVEPDLLPGSELGSRRWVMQQIWFRPVDAGRPEES